GAFDHPIEEVGAWHKRAELQFRHLCTWTMVSSGVHAIVPWAIHTSVHRGTIRRSRCALQCRQVTDPLHAVWGADASGALCRVADTQELVLQDRRPSAIAKGMGAAEHQLQLR